MILSNPHPAVLAMLGLACSCKHKPEEPEPEPTEESSGSEEDGSEETEAPATGPPAGMNPVRETMARAFSGRDGAPPCDEIEEMASETPLEDLSWVVANIENPPWVGMRAAGCILENHSVDASELLESWVVDPALRGLAILVLDNLDALPQAQAWDLARLAILEGPDPDGSRERIAKSENPIISDLATMPLEKEESAPPAP
jgi:hypothetical protein